MHSPVRAGDVQSARSLSWQALISVQPMGTTSQLLPSDQGKLRGEGILTLNLDYRNGLSSFASATIYGGEDLFGAGGKAGLRYPW